jgi:hypothetical protein
MLNKNSDQLVDNIALPLIIRLQIITVMDKAINTTSLVLSDTQF